MAITLNTETYGVKRHTVTLDRCDIESAIRKEVATAFPNLPKHWDAPKFEWCETSDGEVYVEAIYNVKLTAPPANGASDE